MIWARPLGVLSADFEVSDDERVLARWDAAWFRERASFSLDGEEYAIGRESLLGAYTLDGPRGTIVRATKRALRRHFDLEFAEAPDAELRVDGWWGTRYALVRDGEVVGTVARQGWIGRALQADLPEDLPPAVSVFVLWLVVMLHRDEDAS